MKLVITFGSLALVGANDGLDPEASGSAYAEELRRALCASGPRLRSKFTRFGRVTACARRLARPMTSRPAAQSASPWI